MFLSDHAFVLSAKFKLLNKENPGLTHYYYLCVCVCVCVFCECECGWGWVSVCFAWSKVNE